MEGASKYFCSKTHAREQHQIDTRLSTKIESRASIVFIDTELNISEKLSAYLLYVLSFYGDGSRCEPEILLGTTICTLLSYPIMNREMIEETINQPEYDYLLGSNLLQQMEEIAIVLSPINEELFDTVRSSIWIPPVKNYAVSIPVEVGPIIIERKKAVLHEEKMKI